MFLVFGIKFKSETIPYTKVQKLICAHCKKESPFIRVRGKKYICLYFLPLIPIGKEVEVIRCGSCKTLFDLPENWDFEDEKKQATVAEDYIKLLIKDKK